MTYNPARDSERIATLEKQNAELQERIVKLEGANNVLNKRIIEFMEHFARDFDNRVSEAMSKARSKQRGLQPPNVL